LFGVISQVKACPAGNIYLLDSQLSEVKVFSPEGEFLKTLSREGDGPGEVRNPNDMIFMPDGTLGLVQQFPGKIVQVDLDGNPAGDFSPGNKAADAGGFIALADAKSGGGNLVLGGVSISVDAQAQAQDRTVYVASFDETGAEKVRYQDLTYRWAPPSVTLTEWQMLFLWRRWAVNDKGQVLLPPVHDEYAIHVFNPDGSVDRVIEREYESWARGGGDPSVAETVMGAIQRGIERQGVPDVNTEMEPNEPDINRIHIRDDGSIWVLSSRGFREQQDGIMCTFDVFNEAGHFQKKVGVACEGDGVNDGLFFVGSDRVVVVTGFIDALIAQMGGGGGGTEDDVEEAAPMEVICFQIL
jgi:hypothetical protein